MGNFATGSLTDEVHTILLADGYPPITRHRLTEISTETGAKIEVNYSTAACPSSRPAVSANTSLCEPDYWTPDGQSSPMLDWFNKFIVTHVTQQDPTGGSAKRRHGHHVCPGRWGRLAA